MAADLESQLCIPVAWGLECPICCCCRAQELPYILHPVTTEARRLPSGSMLLKQTIFVDHIGVRTQPRTACLF